MKTVLKTIHKQADIILAIILILGFITIVLFGDPITGALKRYMYVIVYSLMSNGSPIGLAQDLVDVYGSNSLIGGIGLIVLGQCDTNSIILLYFFLIVSLSIKHNQIIRFYLSVFVKNRCLNIKKR